jgi:hypothetical protein
MVTNVKPENIYVQDTICQEDYSPRELYAFF